MTIFPRKLFLAVPLICSVLGGCVATIPADALKLSPETLKDRQLQTRRFDTADESKILSACAALLQDIGFTIDSAETGLGLIMATKDRDAINPAQVVAVFAIALLGGGHQPIDTHQKMRASLVTRPIGDGKQMAVRVTFQRMVWNNRGQVTTAEAINDASIYQEFFAKLSKAVFLEAQDL